MTRAFPRRQHVKQHGAVALIFGLTLVVLIGFVGLAIDLGRFFVVKSEVQNAMDACALAAASQLRPGQNNPAALTRAVAYGQVFSSGGAAHTEAIMNRANFQSVAVAIAAADITFADSLDGAYLDSAHANYNTARYARCSHTLTGLPVLFMGMLKLQGSDTGAATQGVSAMATATLSASNTTCAIPIGVCMAAGGTAANNYGLLEGHWIAAKSTSAYGTGNFGWIDFSPPNGGTSELADLLTGSGQCDVSIGQPVGEQGQKTGLNVAWNSRFGWYKHGGGNPQLTTAPTDFTGYAYSAGTNWPGAVNAYSGSSSVGGALNYQAATNAYQPYQGDTPKGIKDNTYTPSTVAEHKTGRKNRRIAVAPVVDCSVWNTSGSAQPVIQDWACVLMLNPFLSGHPGSGEEAWDIPLVEFLGLSSKAGSPCATGGQAGAGGPLVPQLVQ